MKLSELPPGTAIITVDVVGLDKIKPGDVVMVGVKATVSENGDVIPANEMMRAYQREINEAIGNDVIIIKRKTV